MGQASSSIPTPPPEIIRNIFDELAPSPLSQPLTSQGPHPPQFSDTLPTLIALSRSSKWLHEVVTPLMFVQLKIDFDQPADGLEALRKRFQEDKGLRKTVRELQIHGSISSRKEGLSEAKALHRILRTMTSLRYVAVKIIRWHREDYSRIHNQLSNHRKLSQLDLFGETVSPFGSLTLPPLPALAHLRIFSTISHMPSFDLSWTADALPCLRTLSFIGHGLLPGKKLVSMAPELKELYFRVDSVHGAVILHHYIEWMPPQTNKFCFSITAPDLMSAVAPDISLNESDSDSFFKAEALEPFAGLSNLESLQLLEVDFLWVDGVRHVDATVRQLRSALLGSSRHIQRLHVRLHFSSGVTEGERRATSSVSREYIFREGTEVEIECVDMTSDHKDKEESWNSLFGWH